MKLTYIVCLGLVAGMVVGCGKNPSAPSPSTSPVILSLEIDFPGASVETVEASSTGFRPKILVIPGVQNITCVSRQGQFKGFVVADPSVNLIDLQDAVLAAIRPDLVPPTKVRPITRFIKGNVPTVTPKNVSSVVLHLDKDKLLALGLTPGDVEAAVGADATSQPSETQIIAYKDSRPVRLGDIATLTTEIKPDCIVTTHRPSQPASRLAAQ
jgi:multidrug efflux pump subunit AcrB